MTTEARGSPASRERAFKGAVAGKARRKAVVTGYVAGTEPLVEVRLLRDHRDQGEAIDLTFPQARQMVRLLLDAIEGAADLARHDGTSSPAAGRAPAVREHADVGYQARDRA